MLLDLGLNINVILFDLNHMRMPDGVNKNHYLLTSLTYLILVIISSKPKPGSVEV